MKIVYYLPSLYIAGGLERTITLKANYLADSMGYSVTILTSEQQEKKPYYKLSKNVNHVDLGISFDLPKNQSKIKKLISYPFKYNRFKRRFSSFLNEYKPDITISTLRREIYFINSINDGSIKIGEFHVTRNSYHTSSTKSSGNHIINALKKIWTNYSLYKIKKLSKFIVLTNGEKANWPELQNTLVINNPLSFYPKKSSMCSNHQVIAVGRYSPEKGIESPIDAWAIVTKKHPDWILTFFGNGEYNIYTEQIKKLNIEKTCFLESAVTNIEDKYYDSSILALTSKYESFGMVITEAMSCGVPVVSFDCPSGPKDIIQNGIDGILVENGNIQELADKICYLIENEDIRKGLGKQAKINSERFKIENIAVQWQELFNSLLQSKDI